MDAAVQFIPATLRDLATLRRLEKLCFPLDAWPLLDMIGALSLPNIVRLKAVDRSEVIGFIAGEMRAFNKTGWIATVCVHPEYRGRGIGDELLRLCEEQMAMPHLRLTVRESNTAAIALYQRNGYIQAGRWRQYYKGGEDGIVMEKINKS